MITTVSDPVDDPPSPSGGPPAHSRSSGYRDLLVVLVVPVLVLLALRVSPFFKLNNGDPFIYVGYSNAFRTHVERFGYTYHSVRFGLIFPLRASLSLGPFVGYFVLRYVLYLAATVPMWFVLRPLGRRVALFGPIFFVANPVSAQAILTTHPDTIVVPALLFVLCMSVLSARAASRIPRSVLAILAGLGTGVAMNANIFAAPLLGIITLSTCVVLVQQRRYAAASSIAALTALGAIAVSLVGVLVYSRMFGDWNIYRTTWNAMNDISSSEVWRTPGLEWMSTRRYIYAPAIAVLFAAAVLLRRRKNAGWPPAPELIIFFAVSAGLLFYLVHQFVLEGTSMEQAYYYSYLIGPACLLVAVTLSWQGGYERLPVWVVFVTPVGLAYASQAVEVRAFLLFAFIVGLLMLAMCRSRTLGAGLLAVAAMQLSWGSSPRSIEPIEGAGFQYEPHYERVFGDDDRAGFESYLVASQLPAVVPTSPGTLLPLLFWYRSGDAVLDSTQATYLWETLAVQRSPAPGMPSISDDDMTRLVSLEGGHLVMLALAHDELSTGLEALEAEGFIVDATAEVEELQAGNTLVLVHPVRVIDVPPIEGE